MNLTFTFLNPSQLVLSSLVALLYYMQDWQWTVHRMLPGG